MTRCAVLTYHSHNIFGTDYAVNDHIALASDLRALHALGVEIVPLERIAETCSGHEDGGERPLVGISFDDGPIFDVQDFDHPQFGSQRSFLNILRDFRDEIGDDAQPGLHATSFVIASPEARRAMERAPDCGYTFLEDWLTDEWWTRALDSGLMDIGNHSWDHVHHAFEGVGIRSSARDDFTVVDNFDDAEKEIRAASRFIESRLGRPAPLFAYPFGHVNDYLVKDYLPKHGPTFGLQAAFGTAGVAGDRDSVWNIPRLVCGYNWRSPAALGQLISRAFEATVKRAG